MTRVPKAKRMDGSSRSGRMEPHLANDHPSHRDRIFERQVHFACLRQGWYTAVPEIAVGAWMALVGLIFLLCHDGGSITLLGLILLIVSCAVPVWVERLLDFTFVVPAGVCVPRPSRERAPMALALVAFSTFVLLALYDAVVAHSMTLGAGLVVSLLLTAAFAAYGSQRLLVCAAVCLVPFALASQLEVLFKLQGIQTYGLALLIAGAVLFVVGIRVFMGALTVDDSQVDPSTGTIPDDGSWYSVGQLQAALCSPDPDIRLLCALFLEEYACPEVLPNLIRLTGDTSPLVAQAARRALSAIWGPDPEDLIRWEIEHGIKTSNGKGQYISMEHLEELNRERLAIERRSKMHERHVEQVLATQVATDDTLLDGLIGLASAPGAGDDQTAAETRIVAAELLGSTKAHRAYAVLVQLMLSGDRELRSAAAEGFKGASIEAVVHLEPLFGDPREWVRIEAVNAGINLMNSLDETDEHGASVARTMLHDEVFALAHHPSPVTRANSLELLAQYGQQSIAELEHLCGDTFALVRGEAVRALALTDAVAAHPHVMAALRDKRAFVRMTALNCVGYLKEGDALPQVQLMLTDADARVAALARRVLFVSKTW